MNVDELRSLGNKKSASKKQSSNLIGSAIYLFSGIITTLSCAYMGYYYYVYTYGEQVTLHIQAAGEETEVEIPKVALDISRQAGAAFAKDMINVPDTFNASDTFSRKYNECRSEWADRQPKDKDMAMLNFGDAMLRKQFGGRSKGLAQIMICLTDGKTGYLCDKEYRSKFSKLVTKFMDSGKSSNLGVKMTQSSRKKRLARLSEEEREEFLRDNELGKFDPGYIRIRSLFKAGYLRHGDFAGLFFSPSWLKNMSSDAGDPATVCNA